MLDMLINLVVQKVGISPEIAKMAIPLVSKFILQKSTPDQASGLLSTLPSDITGMFSDHEKKDFAMTQQNLTEEDLINTIDSKCGINNKEKSKQTVTEIMKSLQQNSGQGQGDLFGNTLGKLGKGDFNLFG